MSSFDCPKCHASTEVRDSRPTEDGIRRRRKCTTCNERFTTFETARADFDGVANSQEKAVLARQLNEVTRLLPKVGPEDRSAVLQLLRRFSASEGAAA